MGIDELVGVAEGLRRSHRRCILGIAGPPGAGKSTFAEALVGRLRELPGGAGTVALLPMDGFHLLNEELVRLGLRERKGAPETFDVEAYLELLRKVRDLPDESWPAPGFSRVTDAPVPGAHRIPPEVRLVVTEGNYLLLPGPWAPVRELCAQIWYLDVDPATQRERLIRRQIEDCGRDRAAATEWVVRSDLVNAALVRAQSAEPTLRIMLTKC